MPAAAISRPSVHGSAETGHIRVRPVLAATFTDSGLLTLNVFVQDSSQLDEFKDALRQAAQTITTIKIVFADASANAGARCLYFVYVLLSLLHGVLQSTAYAAAHSSHCLSLSSNSHTLWLAQRHLTRL